MFHKRSNNCESNRAMIQVNVNASSSVVACPTIKVYLEGNWNGTEMTTTLNQQGLLPGQIPISPFGIATPSGQPYKTAPWNYLGTETVSNYDSDVVDWVLISLRTNIADANSVVYKTAALLRKTGTVTLLAACPLLNPSLSYSVVIEHRGHIGAASHQPISIVDNKITYDFTQQQSYIPINLPSSGQQKVGLPFIVYLRVIVVKPRFQKLMPMMPVFGELTMGNLLVISSRIIIWTERLMSMMMLFGGEIMVNFQGLVFKIGTLIAVYKQGGKENTLKNRTILFISL
jgi:hypothetical protein